MIPTDLGGNTPGAAGIPEANHISQQLERRHPTWPE